MAVASGADDWTETAPMAAQIERPHLPPRIFRYRRLPAGSDDTSMLQRELDAIREHYLWCSDFKHMNDPMEGFYHPSIRLKGMPNADRIEEAILQQKAHVGIACFSETKENELMWTDYAADYGGMCIAYATQRLVDRLQDNVSLVRVAYGDAVPLISSKEASDVDAAARHILSHKKLNWQYEREWRVLGKVGRNDIRRRAPHLITDIYLGSRINRDFQHEIVRQATDLDILAHQMTISGYKHRWKTLNPKGKPVRSIPPLPPHSA
jgi:hypothetical protein